MFFFQQNIYSQNIDGGLIIGVSTAQVSGDRLAGFNKAGILFGAFANISLSEITKFQMELSYIEKGSNNPKIETNNIPDISLKYIEIPLVLKYQQSESIYIELGGQFGVLMHGLDEDMYGIIDKSRINEFSNIDIGALAGFYYEFFKNTTLNTRISNSILAIRDHASGSTTKLNKGQYNSVLSFSIHYTF